MAIMRAKKYFVISDAETSPAIGDLLKALSIKTVLEPMTFPF